MHPHPAPILLTAAALTACPAHADTFEVFVVNEAFITAQGDRNVTLRPGDTVRWIWAGGHHSTTSVVGIPEVWNSDAQTAPFTFEHTFTHVGVWWYYCIPHGGDNGDGTASGMAATVTVVADDTCPPDWNDDGAVTSDDFFAFLAAFFEGC